MKFVPVRPYVMMSKDNPSDPRSRLHPHVIVGKTKDGLVSVQVTHSPSVDGKKTVKVPDNIRKTYAISKAYVRKASDYVEPYHAESYSISGRDAFVFGKMARKTKVPLK